MTYKQFWISLHIFAIAALVAFWITSEIMAELPFDIHIPNPEEIAEEIEKDLPAERVKFEDEEGNTYEIV